MRLTQSVDCTILRHYLRRCIFCKILSRLLVAYFVALFLGFLRQFLQTQLQLRVDLKMYLNRWTTQTSYFNYSDSGRNLLKATEQNTECTYTRFMHKRVFSCDNYMFRIFCVRRFYLAHTHVFTTLKLCQWDRL